MRLCACQLRSMDDNVNVSALAIFRFDRDKDRDEAIIKRERVGWRTACPKARAKKLHLRRGSRGLAVAPMVQRELLQHLGRCTSYNPSRMTMDGPGAHTDTWQHLARYDRPCTRAASAWAHPARARLPVPPQHNHDRSRRGGPNQPRRGYTQYCEEWPVQRQQLDCAEPMDA